MPPDDQASSPIPGNERSRREDSVYILMKMDARAKPREKKPSWNGLSAESSTRGDVGRQFSPTLLLRL